MKTRIINTIGLIALIISSSVSYGQDLPMPSPSATTIQKVGLTDVTIVYSRPGVKDRVIFGDLVKYNEMWRTGANKATAITFSTDVEIMGNALKAGTYALFTIPGENEWEIIFNSNTEQWGTYEHKDEEDVLKVKVKPESAEFRESMLFYIDDLKNESATINLHWDKIRVSIPITTNTSDQAKINIEAAIAEANGTFRVYNGSARYYLDNNMDVVQALEWAKKSVSMAKKYWNLTTLSRAEAANGNYKEAIKLAEEAKQLAVEGKSDGYIKQNEENIATWKGKK